MYGRDRMARKWLVHIDGILEALSPIRVQFVGGEQDVPSPNRPRGR